MSDRAPVQSTRTSPGSSIASASSAATLAGDALDGARVPASMRSLSDLLDRVERDEAARPLLEQRAQVRRRPSGGRPAASRARSVEDRLDVLAVDRVRPVALDRVGDEVRRRATPSGSACTRSAARRAAPAVRRPTGGAPPGTGRPARRRRCGRDLRDARPGSPRTGFAGWDAPPAPERAASRISGWYAPVKDLAAA